MKNGKCPKCNSDDIYNGSNISSKTGVQLSNTIPITSFFPVPLDNYICINCGYVESYISDKEALKKIKEKWPKV